MYSRLVFLWKKEKNFIFHYFDREKATKEQSHGKNKELRQKLFFTFLCLKSGLRELCLSSSAALGN